MPEHTSTELVTYPVTAAAIAETRERFAGLSCDTPRGYEEVRLAIGQVRDVRTAVEKRRVELKADSVAYGRLVDSRAKELTSLLLEIEEPLKAKKAAVDDEKARIKAEAEAVKLRALEAEITARRLAQETEARLIREAEEERLAEERAAIELERAKLAEAQAALEAARKAEADRIEAVRRAEQERIDAMRTAQIEADRLAAQAERERIDAEREKLAAEKRVEEERQRTAREALAAERKAVAAEREAQERAEFERQAKARAEKEAAAKVERDQVEKAQAQAELAALRPDLEKVAAFADEIRALKVPDVGSDVLADALVTAWDALGTVADDLDGIVLGWRKVAA